ncbi:glycosyltransferase involved in cell wall biosynthesis [Nakamurella sp. UYEF19]|uniref:glycosyltransferase n=1 Tax=Nakamurella sp. UYEF19 TaxID=1756392 RepID=UPI00339A8052
MSPVPVSAAGSSVSSTAPVPLSPAASTRLALASRLRSVAALIIAPAAVPAPDPDPAADAAAVLDAVVTALVADPAADSVWLLLTALSATFPTRDEVQEARRRLELDEPLQAALDLLDAGLERAQLVGDPLAELDVVIGGVVVDVDHTARFNLHTGIQRVARNLMPHWMNHPGLVAAAWTARGGGLRRLTERETERVFDWTARGGAGEGQQPGISRTAGEPLPRLVVPWRSVVVMVEVPPAMVSDRVAALGDHSGNRVVGIGYDAIPVVSADMVPPVESAKFVRYLTAVKFARRIAGISAAATAELGGFVSMLPTQGLTGPVVTEVSLPAPAMPDRPVSAAPASGTGGPLVLVVGSHEPRKNHLAVLHAAEILWREGRAFTLRFIGGSGWGDEFPRRANDLAETGRPVEILKAVDDTVLEQSFSDAAFTLFPSLHEGYGLPVVESLAHGTPAISSDFGSTAEIALDGGVLTIDPRDDHALTDAMRVLLTDPAVLATLREQITRRTGRTWARYATELWTTLVTPELEDLDARR